MFNKATSQQLWAIYEGGDCPSHLFSELVKESMKREEFINYKMYHKATNEQLWVIAKHDKECPTHLLIGVVNELIRRNEMEKFIYRVLLNLFKSIPAAEEFTFMAKEDLVQIGYEAAIESLHEFKQGYGTYTNYLYFVLTNKFKEVSRDLMADKRKTIKHTFSYQCTADKTEDTSKAYEYFLPDHRISVEKEVIQKIMMEEKINLLTPKQTKVFLKYLKGYTLQEIADELGFHKTTIHKHLTRAIIKMAGRKINLSQLGAFERASFKNLQAYTA